MRSSPGRSVRRTAPWALVAVAVFAFAPEPARAQDDFGTTAATLLRLPVGVRPIALGDAYSAVRGDELSIFYNPGAVASADAPAAGASYHSYISGSDLVTASGVVTLGPGRLAAGLLGLDYGSVDEIVEDPTFAGQTGIPTGNEVGASEFVATLGYALSPVPILGVGVSAKLVRVDIAGESGTAVAADLGARVQPWEHGPSFGASLLNLGTDLELAGRSDPLPLSLRVGGAFEARGPGAFTGVIAADLIAVRGGATRIAAGVEAGRAVAGARLAGRIGVQADGAEESLTRPITLGAGLEVASIRVDYAYLGFETFGATHRFGVRWGRR